MKNFKWNHFGFGLPEVVIALGIVSIVGLGIGSVLTTTFKKQRNVMTDKNIDLLRETVLNALQNDQAFLKTLKNPVNANVFSCLNSAADCRGAGGEFKIFDKNDTALLMSSFSTESNMGFDSSGTSCSSYDAKTGSDDCPFKYVAVWAAECYGSQNIKGMASVETACRDPLIKIAVTFYSNPVDQAKFSIVNVNKMKISLVKSQNDAALADQGLSELKNMCATMLGGIYDPVGSTCVLPTTNPISCENACGAGQQATVSGFNSDGTPTCNCAVAGTTTTCNPTGTVGRVLSSVDNRGNLTCNDGIVPVLVANGNINNPPVPFTPPPPPAPPPAAVVQPAAALGGDGAIFGDGAAAGDGGGDGGDGGN